MNREILMPSRGGGRRGSSASSWQAPFGYFLFLVLGVVLVFSVRKSPLPVERPSVERLSDQSGSSAEDASLSQRGSPRARALAQELETLNQVMEEGIPRESGSDPETASFQDAAKLEARGEKRGVRIEILAAEFFSEEQVRPHPDVLPLLRKLGVALSQSPYRIQLEGHADRQESSARHWELSAGRAAWIARFWEECCQMRADRFEVKAAATARLRDLGNGVDSRARNRRVDILVRIPE